MAIEKTEIEIEVNETFAVSRPTATALLLELAENREEIERQRRIIRRQRSELDSLKDEIATLNRSDDSATDD